MLMPFSEKIATRGIVASASIVGLGLASLVVSLVGGFSVLLPLFALLYGTLTLGISVVLFATFSQTKSRSLRGLTRPERSALPAAADEADERIGA
jgi:hypothetical protein